MQYEAVVAVLIAYLLAGIPIGLLVGRARGIDDIRKYGSGNIGASNVLRLLGTRAGLAVWLADALKGYAPVALARYGFGLDGWGLAAVAVAAIVGHCFSPYLKLTGGRGVSTSLGTFIGLDWRVGLLAFGVWLVVVGLTRYISLGSIVGTAMVVPLFVLFGTETSSITAGAVVAFLVILKHRSNIARLLQGTERKIGQREKTVETGGENEAGC